MTNPKTGDHSAFHLLNHLGLIALVCMVMLTPKPAFAIPSPELVIGSVSSLSQVFAVAFATLTGTATLFARRFGYTPASKGGTRRYPIRLILSLVGIVVALGALNMWQHQTQKSENQTRLQATLVRPAQFDGQAIKDKNLKETNFSKQSTSPLAITTQVAQRLLTQDSTTTTAFFDVREAGEHRMGTLPGAQHVRFPDFLQSDLAFEGKQVVLFCHNGNRSSETCAELAARGIDCRFIAGGIEKWIVEGKPFSDKAVKTLSDLRAIPNYPNKNVLIGTKQFKELTTKSDLQIVDTRYPGDFATGHLPGAINIPIRALPTDELKKRIAQLQDKPTIAACYDRRSCFMAQVLGLEMSEAGIDFQGRYTTPWEFFIPPKPKPHVEAWLAAQQATLWDKAVGALASALTWVGKHSHFVVGLLMLSLLSRLLVLPIALKSERDQITTAQHANEFTTLKQKLRHDPVRKARAVQQFYTDNGLTPMRNLTALLFLPIMMLGLSATGQAGKNTTDHFLWIQQLGLPDSTYALPILFSALGGVYLHWAVAKTRRQAMIWWAIGTPLLFALTCGLSAAGNIYLCISLILLLIQRAYVTGFPGRMSRKFEEFSQYRVDSRLPKGVIPLRLSASLQGSGNKSYRLSLLKNAGLPVPDGLVIRSSAIAQFGAMSDADKTAFASKIWRQVGPNPCAVRSSAASEDGADNSYAGVFDSVLDVTEHSLRAALDTVIASFSSQRAASYDNNGPVVHDGNILVQRMISPDYAGVMFTQDPTAPGLMMIELVKGNGDDLVSGRVTPQSLRFGRHSLAAIDTKLTPMDLTPLIMLGHQIETLIGCPQDIEWAYANGTFHIVQSRDITTLAARDPAQLARNAEWQRILATYKDAPADAVILEQDEMSEVLPQPTPLSFSLMSRIWSPGGSVDLACRALGVGYNLPEGPPEYLVNLFGRTYVDQQLKTGLTLRLSKPKARQLRKMAPQIITEFRTKFIPKLANDLAYWQALDFAALPQKQLIETITALQDKLVTEVYVEAEKINIIAGFTLNEAETLAIHDAEIHERLQHPVLHHTPIRLIDACAALPPAEQKPALLAQMGHRAIFDYELSIPRYNETPALLWPLLDSAMPLAANEAGAPVLNPDNPVDLAVAYQDLKEQAKHEALKTFAQLRRAIVALSDKADLSDLIFQLEMDELETLDDIDPAIIRSKTQHRKDQAALLRQHAPSQISLTLQDCERLSAPSLAGCDHDQEGMGGTCVAGSQAIKARVFHITDETRIDASVFDGFEDGDIIVCRMVNPAWLPWVQRAGGVLSEIGGWLSHMAIVARERDILMLVGCTHMDQLHSGMIVQVELDGSITAEDAPVSLARPVPASVRSRP
ncbi:PEP/pyruvate-binding domain-containing protein [Roseovarius sp. EL26]|uniref:PEP/pyruvate-binding domain-containing protein n=1 Tax=Roseovarius sp. EL26 TaxID=2126672 RepID=UPI0020B1448C|nr:PEP/pyruvate-binding domain-containing protein [Roseovarius sp. EL26]